MRATRWTFLATVLFYGAAGAQPAGEQKSFEPIFTGGGVQVHLKMDFDKGDNPFIKEANGAVELESRPGYVVSGRSLHVKRAQPGGYFGGRTNRIAVQGTRGLNIAFCVRAKGMQKVSLNFYDALKKDNTTPASPARVVDDVWRTVVFAVEDFHHNESPPQRKVPANTRHTSLFFHGPEQTGRSGEYWIDKFAIYRGVDTAPPEPPANLRAVDRGKGRVELTWDEPNDNVFPAVYSIFRKPAGGRWRKVGESIPPRFEDAVSQAGALTYCVTAADYDNNVSKPSAGASITPKGVPAGQAAAPAGDPVKDREGYAENVRKIHAAGKGKVRHDVFVFQGDSITAADAYGFTLCSWLGRGINVKRGTGMMRTSFGKNTIAKDLSGAKPEFAVIMWGTNNAKSEQAVQAGMQDMSALIDTCVEFGTVPIVATIPPRGFSKDKQDGQVRFNTALIELCRKKKVPVSYCFEEMMKRELKQMLGDGVHLKPGPGNDAAGEALLRTIQQVYWALRDTSGSWE